MSREIKFRAWNSKENEMMFADIYEMQDISGDWTDWEFPEGTPVNTGKSFDIMQYTGLKDANGIEIYEGDVCEIMYYTPFGDKTDDYYGDWVVTHWMGQWMLQSEKTKLVFIDFANVVSEEYVSNLGTIRDYSDIVNVKVKGNIHQNPELLDDSTK